MLFPILACTSESAKCDTCAADDTASESVGILDSDTAEVVESGESDSGRPSDLDCDEVADGCTESLGEITIETERDVQGFGGTVAFLGDLDGDSTDDILLTDVGYFDYFKSPSAVVVLSGALETGYNLDSDVAWAKWSNPDLFRPAGDTDRDGRDELLMLCGVGGLPAIQLLHHFETSFEDRPPCSSESARVGEDPEWSAVDISWGTGDVDGDGWDEFAYQEITGVHHLVSMDVFSTEGALLDDTIEITAGGYTEEVLGDLDGDGLVDATFTDPSGYSVWFYSGAGLARGTSYTEADADRIYGLDPKGLAGAWARIGPDLDGDGLGEQALLTRVDWDPESYHLRFVNPATAESLDDASAVVESSSEHRIIDFWFPGDMNSDGFEDVAVSAEDTDDDQMGFRIWAGGSFSGTYTIDDGAFFYLWGSDTGQSPGFGGPFGQGDVNGDGELDLLFGNELANAAHVIFGPLAE